jgi:hypothetical protein
MDIPYASQETAGRQGKLFFKLCDMRTATIAVASLNIVLVLIGTLIHLIRFFGFIPISAAIPALVLSCIAIFGAVNFELWAVGMAAVGFAVSLVIDLWWLNIFGIVMGVLVLYPTAILAHELRTGIMSKATYNREEFIDYEVAEKAGVKKEYIATFNEKVSGTFTYSQQQ